MFITFFIRFQAGRPWCAELLQRFALSLHDRRCQMQEIGNFHQFGIRIFIGRRHCFPWISVTLTNWQRHRRGVECFWARPNIAPILIFTHISVAGNWLEQNDEKHINGNSSYDSAYRCFTERLNGFLFCICVCSCFGSKFNTRNSEIHES